VVTANFELSRERVVSAAAELFARYGYHGTGIAELGKTVGMGRGALYRYIGSKEALLYEISRKQVDVMNDLAKKALGADTPADELLRTMARQLMRNIADHQAEWSVFFRDYSALTGMRRDRVIAARERYEGYWRQAMERGVREGVLQSTDQVVVKGILGMLNYSYLWYEADGDMTPEQIAETFIDAVLWGIGATTDRPSARATSPR